MKFLRENRLDLIPKPGSLNNILAEAGEKRLKTSTLQLLRPPAREVMDGFGPPEISNHWVSEQQGRLFEASFP